MWADLIYVGLLFLSIAVGPFYNQIQDPSVKQWTSTAIGFTITAIVSGSFLLHPLIATLINAIIITKLSPKICHLTSFFFSFFYLLVVFRLGHLVGLPVPPGHTNLIVMILTLKLSGLAFEINSAANAPPDNPDGARCDALEQVTALDVIHYAYGYMGVLTGPYYRYRTYWDSLHRPFSKYADPWPTAFHKIKQVLVFIVLFLIMNKLYPTEYVITEEFSERSFLYRNFYMYPTFAVFRLRLYIGTILAECACHMAKVGVYPAESKPVQGLGPRNYKVIEEFSATSEKLKDEEFDFNTVHNMNALGVEKCFSVRTAMKTWNSCVQYWMATCVYKRFPSKSLRTLVTFLLSALWHGYAPGYYFCLCQIPLFLLSEDICMKFYKQSEENSFARIGWRVFLWYLKTTCMAYLGVTFLLLGFYESLHYYKVVYCSGHIQAILFYIAARYLKPYILVKQVESKKKDT